MELTSTSMLQPAATFDPADAVPTGGAGGGRGGFGKLLEKAKAAASSTSKDAAKQARDAAAGLVAEALILPVLRQVRQSTFIGNGPFSPGSGEKMFGPQFDTQLADRLAHSPRMGATDALARQLMKHAAAAGSAARKLNLHG